MSIRAKLAALFAVTLTAFVALSGILFWSADATARLQRRADLNQADLLLHMALAVEVHRYIGEATHVLLTGDAQHPDAAETRARVERSFEAIGALRHEIHASDLRDEEADERQRDDELREIFGRLAAGIDVALSLRQERGTRAAGEALHRTIDRDFERTFLPRVNEAVAEERREADEQREQIAALHTWTRVVSVASALAAFGVVSALLYATRRSIERGLAALLQGSERLASGDLDARLGDLGKHELGQLAARFDHMAESLADAQAARIRVEKLAAIGQLAASIGHDLRNPLAAVSNAGHYVQRRIAKSELATDAKLTELLAVMDRELSSCAKIVGDLLDYARTRAPVLTECPVGPLVADAIGLVPTDGRVRVESEVPDALPPLRGDRDQLRQVLVNLVQNAVEAIPEGRDGRVRVLATATETEHAITVADDGQGIPEHTQGRIFEPLVTTKSKGTGLGLAIVANIVEHHGGSIEVESGAGAGTRFTIKLPRRPGPEPSARSHP